METIRQYKKGNEILKIYPDQEPEDPRSWDNLGKMVCFHKRYNLGDKTNLKSDSFNNWKELEDHLIKELNAKYIYPLSLYNHSGITIKMGLGFIGDPAGWDSGQIGFIYLDKQTCKDNNIKTEKKAREILNQEVKVYDKYLIGEVFGFELYQINKPEYCKCCKTQTNQTEELKDSCWGFFDIEDIFQHIGEDIKKWEEI